MHAVSDARGAAVDDRRDILVAGDRGTSRAAIEAAVEPLQRTVVFVDSEREVLARLLHQDFALIVIDLELLGVLGFEIAHMIRSRERSAQTPLIVITAMPAADTTIVNGYELGRIDFLTKPIHPVVLRAKVKIFLELDQHNKLDALERQLNELVRADRRKDEFLAILAHELRNPLQPLRTAIDLIRQRPEVPVSKRTLEILERRVHHMTRLVDDLLDVARLATGKLSLRNEPVLLATVVEAAVNACRDTLAARNHVVVVSAIPGAADAVIDGDFVRLVQIVSNLLDNAAKYTDPGGRIDVVWGSDNAELFVYIADNGHGIAAELLPKIFDMYVQERIASDSPGGLGLGLALVKHLVELHHGTIQVRSDGLGKGTTFEVVLPAGNPTLRPGEALEPAQPELRHALRDA